jgi:hypothetical protein
VFDVGHDGLKVNINCARFWGAKYGWGVGLAPSIITSMEPNFFINKSCVSSRDYFVLLLANKNMCWHTGTHLHVLAI